MLEVASPAITRPLARVNWSAGVTWTMIPFIAGQRNELKIAPDTVTAYTCHTSSRPRIKRAAMIRVLAAIPISEKSRVRRRSHRSAIAPETCERMSPVTTMNSEFIANCVAEPVRW